MPDVTTIVLLMFIASWAVVTGVLQIWGAIEMRKELEDGWLLALNGVLWIAFGIVMVVWPDAGALGFVWTLGWFAVASGFLFITLAVRLKTRKDPA